MNILDLPDELLYKILSLCEWKSIIMFLSTNKYLYQFKSADNFVNVLKKRFFNNINVNDIKDNNLQFYSLLCNKNINKNINKPENKSFEYYFNIIDKIKNCKNCSVHMTKVKKTMDYMNETVYLINEYTNRHDIDIASITFLNLDYLNNYLLSSINNYGKYCKDIDIIYELIVSIIYFEKKIIICSLYTNLYADLLLKNIPGFLLKLIKNEFYSSGYVLRTMYLLRDYYIGDLIINNTFESEGNYDYIYCYIHILKTCVKHKNNDLNNLEKYIEEIYYLLEISKNSYYKIQLVKHCLNLYKFISYYLRDLLSKNHLEMILQDIKKTDYCHDVGNVVIYTLNILIEIIRYVEVNDNYYQYIYDLLQKSKSEDVFIGSIIVNIICNCRKRETFIDNYCSRCLKELENIINSIHISEQYLMKLTKLIVDKMTFLNLNIIKRLLRYTHDNINTNGNRDSIEYLGEYLEYIENMGDIGDINDIPKVSHFRFDKITFDIVHQIHDDKNLLEPEGFELYELYDNN